MTIIIPHTSTALPAPPAVSTGSQIAYWNRGHNVTVTLEAVRVMAIVRVLLPYVTFAPRDGVGGWTARPAGFNNPKNPAWCYANALDALEDLVADLAIVQPSMSGCIIIDPASNVAVDPDVAQHLPGFHRTFQLLLQTALNVARTASLATVRAYNPAAFPLRPPITMPIVIPHLSIFLPQPPVSPTPSQITNWNRGNATTPQLEALRVMVIIWRLLPYAAFAPRAGPGGWDARPVGFRDSGDLGWGYANTLDILDELVADLATLQPSMSQCAAIDPSSSTVVDADVAQHLPGFCRAAQLLLQYALAIARGASLTAVREYNPTFCPAPNRAIVIPHFSRFLPPPPTSQSISQIAYWNRGVSQPPNQLESLRVMAIIRLLLPYVKFVPKNDGGWAARPAGFHTNSLGWGYANTLDILDDLVADLALIQPSMSRCVTLDPSSDVAVDPDVAHHLPGFCRPAQLLLQYALTVARSADLATVRAYNPAAFPLATSPAATVPRPLTTPLERQWSTLVRHLSGQFPEVSLSTDQMLLCADVLARISSAAQLTARDNAHFALAPENNAENCYRRGDGEGCD